ncbi:MAG: glucose-1-phosphate cytidylyltransferase [Pelagibacteraceae bacterium]|jgi:glucose-1-phosphate cytidylyltransferase|nr:glucose-1-phosphate cytidylyltransferase [Pelagibacteraceae bacterium]
MKAVILAGGFGTRITEESSSKPKPLIEIGGMPIIWHIMKLYSFYGINDFIICCGYKGYLIKEFFSNYYLHSSDVTINLKNNSIDILNKSSEPWSITLINTGEYSQTGGRLLRIKDHIDDTFCMTYGDGVSNVNITKLVDFHKKQSKLGTITAVQPPGRFGALIVKNSLVEGFIEKPQGDGGWINGGFFVLEPEIFDYIEDDSAVWEQQPLRNLAKECQLSSYIHKGFWRPMDTMRDKIDLEELWKKNPPWKVW